MSVLESILYGLISGFTEFLPVSAQGHQALMFSLFGINSREPLRDAFVHIAVLAALMVTCKPLITRLRREQAVLSRRKRKSNADRKGQYVLRLVKTAGFPLLIGLLFYVATRKFEFQLQKLVLFFFINGVILFVPEYIRHGNKDARHMTGLDGILFGAFGACSVLPGISRIGAMNAYALIRGADRQQVVNWALALSFPALVLYLGFDIYNIFAIGVTVTDFIGVLSCILSGIVAFFGAYFSVRLVRFLTVQAGFVGCAYYSWGTALFAFVLYLIV